MLSNIQARPTVVRPENQALAQAASRAPVQASEDRMEHNHSPTTAIPAEDPALQLPRSAKTEAARAVASDTEAPAGSYRFRVPGPFTPQELQHLNERYDVLHGHHDHDHRALDVIVEGPDVDSFAKLFPKAELIDRGRPYGDIEQSQGIRPDDGYFTVAEMNAELDKLAAEYPNYAKKMNLSELPGAEKTHEGRSIFALRVTKDVDTAHTKRAIVVASQHHARELNSPYMVINAMRKVLASAESDPEMKKLLEESEIYFVPTMNPDGVNHVWTKDNYWRKNRRDNGNGSHGVDQNRNYDALWARVGSSSWPGSQTYHGPGPASEPETKTLVALANYVRPEVYIDFHSSGQEVLTLYPPRADVSDDIRQLGKDYADDLRGPMNYAIRPPSASGEAPHHFWMNGGAMAFLVEVGTSFQPAFSVTEAEGERVWPGLRHALTSWAPAARGFAKDAQTGAPVKVDISYEPAQLREGETIQGRASDGRFGVWLPKGTHQVTFSAEGYAPVTKTVTVENYNDPVEFDVELQPVAEEAESAA